MTATQLPLSLVPRDSFAPEYFVPHRGVAEAIEMFRHTVAEIRSRLAAEQEVGFHFLFISGPSGSGKTHLGRLLEHLLSEVSADVPCRLFEFHGINQVGDDEIRTFIDAYQRLRGVGGVLAVFSTQPPDDESWDPHLASRFACAHPLTLEYPADDELRPLVQSVLARLNLRLGDAQMEYVLRRLPSRPLSLAHIFDRISSLALAQGKPVGRGIFRAVFDGDEPGR